jgi:F-type H+-transporting ATPase subunit a
MGAIRIENKNLFLFFNFGDIPIYVNQTMLATWIIMGALIIFAVVVRAMIMTRSFKDTPSGLQNLVELAIEMSDKLVIDNAGEKLSFLSGYFFSIFAFILVSNISGMIGLRPPTSDVATTLPLAIFTFLIMHGLGIFYKKGQYFKEYISPNPILLPMNIIGEISKPVSLAFRLFGNILGGLIIMELMYTMLPVALRFVVPDVGHAFFDIFFGALQAFVFTVLSLTFIQLMVSSD